MKNTHILKYLYSNIYNLKISIIIILMIIDCFMFFNEIEILQLRLKLYYDIVDYFIIIDADKTFQGEYKDYLFEKYKDEFKEYEDKIIYKKINIPSIKYLNENYKEYKEYENPWKREYYQRDYIRNILDDLECEPDDIISLSDIDEILYPEKLQEIINNLNNNEDHVYLCHTPDIKYYLNAKNIRSFFGNIVFNYKIFNSIKSHSSFRNNYCFHRSISNVKDTIQKNNLTDKYFIVENAGLHLSSYGGKIMSKAKLYAYSHTEHNPLNKKLNNNIPVKCYNLHNSKKYREEVRIGSLSRFDETYIDINYDDFNPPDYVFDEIKNNKEKYSHLFLFRNPIID